MALINRGGGGGGGAGGGGGGPPRTGVPTLEETMLSIERTNQKHIAFLI